MCKKLIFLVSLVFMLGSAWTSPAEAAEPALVGWWNDPDLLGYWNLDGDTLDTSGLENHGTAQGNPIFEAGKFNEAMYFDGSGDY